MTPSSVRKGAKVTRDSQLKKWATVVGLVVTLLAIISTVGGAGVTIIRDQTLLQNSVDSLQRRADINDKKWSDLQEKINQMAIDIAVIRSKVEQSK